MVCITQLFQPSGHHAITPTSIEGVAAAVSRKWYPLSTRYTKSSGTNSLVIALTTKLCAASTCLHYLMLAKSFDPIDDYSISALHETLADTIVWQ